MASPTVTIYLIERVHPRIDRYQLAGSITFQGHFDDYLRHARSRGLRPLDADELEQMAGKVRGLRGRLLGWMDPDCRVFYECVEEDTFVIRRGVRE